jgi:hypothetical protein
MYVPPNPFPFHWPIGNWIYLTSDYDYVAPSADSPFQTTSFGDTIVVSGSTWQMGDYVDGGFGYDTITGTFHGVDFMPEVRSVEHAQLMADSEQSALDFAHWTGLQYAEIHGTGNSLTDFATAFNRIPLGTKIGVTNYWSNPGGAWFNFAGANGTQSVDLTVDHAGKFGGIFDLTDETIIHVQDIDHAQIHVTGDSNFAFGSNSVHSIALDGSGNVRLHVDQDYTPLLTNVDASAQTGASVLVILPQQAMAVEASQGGSVISTWGNPGDTITFNVGADSYAPLQFHNLTSAADLTTTAGLNAAAITINSFTHNQDKIDFSSFQGINAASGAIVIDNHSAATLDGFATLKNAAEFVAATDGHPGRTIDVFQYHGSTYVFGDYHADNTVEVGDGLIRLTGVTGITLHDFV